MAYNPIKAEIASQMRRSQLKAWKDAYELGDFDKLDFDGMTFSNASQDSLMDFLETLDSEEISEWIQLLVLKITRRRF